MPLSQYLGGRGGQRGRWIFEFKVSLKEKKNLKNSKGTQHFGHWNIAECFSILTQNKD